MLALCGNEFPDMTRVRETDQPSLLAVLVRVADPRHRRGVRHRLAVILSLALCAVVAGARSFTAMRNGPADADEQTLRMAGTGSRGAIRIDVPADLAAPGRGYLR